MLSIKSGWLCANQLGEARGGWIRRQRENTRWERNVEKPLSLFEEKGWRMGGFKNAHSLTSNWRTSADSDQIWKKKGKKEKGHIPLPHPLESTRALAVLTWPWSASLPGGKKNYQGETYQRSGSHVCVHTQMYINGWRWPGHVEHPLVLPLSKNIDHNKNSPVGLYTVLLRCTAKSGNLADVTLKRRATIQRTCQV